MSSELLMRLTANPRMRSALEVLKPKMLELSGDSPVRPVPLPSAQLETRVEEVTQHIQRATFTGKGDKEVVIKLYESYQKRIAEAGLFVFGKKHMREVRMMCLRPSPPLPLCCSTLLDLMAPSLFCCLHPPHSCSRVILMRSILRLVLM